MRAPLLKFFAWVATITTLCWCWVSVPDWRTLAQMGLIASPMLLWQRRQFEERVGPIGIVLVLLVVGVFVVSVAAGWNANSNGWFESTEFRPILALLVWLALVSAGYYAIFKRRAA